MPAISIPGTSIKYGWQQREQGWGTGMSLNMQVLGALAKGAVTSRSETSPPAEPSEGDIYVVAASATGDWSGEDNRLAAYLSAAWVFIEPIGVPFFVEDEGIHVYWNGSGYSQFEGDMAGSGSSTDGEVPRFDGTTGKQLQGSTLRVDDSGNLYGHGATIKDVSDAAYTIVESDNGKILHFTNSGGCTVSVPGTELAYNSNIQCVLVQKGVGTVTVEEMLGAVVKSSGDLFSSAQQWAAMSLYRYNSTDWHLTGERA